MKTENTTYMNKTVLSSLLQAFNITLSGMYFDCLFILINEYHHEIFCVNEDVEIFFPMLFVEFYYVNEKGEKIFFKKSGIQNEYIPIEYAKSEQKMYFAPLLFNKYLKEYGIKSKKIDSIIITEKKFDDNISAHLRIGSYDIILYVCLSKDEFDKLK